MVLLPTLATVAGAAAPSCGPSWGLVTTPDASSGSLYGAAIAGASDAWTVGSRYDGRTDLALTLHWNGSAWSSVAAATAGTASYLAAVTAVAPVDVWAAGHSISGGGAASRGRDRPLANPGCAAIT